ncbi:MAG: hypothetical protein IMZ53_12485 [Thermoplasmata archaeon]|nr:hypothetical protein [Thermoplasmata archaeon]MBE3141383.1 hypothetical protein [Thermoplasmata archaeon]
MNDKLKILEIEKKLKKLQPEFDKIEGTYNKAVKEYNEASRIRQTLQSEIDAIKKKMQVETFNKKVGKGELMSFRTFFDEIRKGRDFSGKTVVWSFKNGKSGMYLNLWIRGSELVSNVLLEKFHTSQIKDTADFIGIVKEFPDLGFDDFDFDAFNVTSMVRDRTFYGKTIDDIFVFICDTKTLNDFDNVADTKGLYFFKNLPYVVRSDGDFHDGYLWLIGYGAGGISEEHYTKYKLYPLQTIEYRG